MDIELTPEDSEVDVSVSIKRLYRALGNQGILGEDVERPEFFYLAALALEVYDDGDDSAASVICEVIRVDDAFDLTEEEYKTIEDILGQ